MSPTTLTPRLALLFGAWLIYLSFGLVVAGIAPLVPQIATELGASPRQMGFVFGAWPLVYILAALPAGALLDRIGVGRGLLLAVAVMALSAMLRSLAGSVPALAAAVALFGIGGPLISVGAPKLVAALFEGRARGVAMGVYMSGPALGSILSLSLTNSLLLPLVGGDWRDVMLLQAGFVLTGGLVWLGITLQPMTRQVLTGIGTAGKYDPAAFREVIGSTEVRLVLAMAIAIFAINHGLNNWLPSLLMGRGIDPVVAGWMAAIPSLVGIAAGLVIPGFAQGARQIPILAEVVTLMLIATLLFQLDNGSALIVALVLQGVARGTMMTLAMLLLMECRDVPKARLGMAAGLFFTMAEIGGVMGPVMFGTLLQASGGFAVPVAAISAICVVLLALLLRLRWRQG